MSQVVSFIEDQPSPRYDSLPWTEVKIEEGTASIGPGCSSTPSPSPRSTPTREPGLPRLHHERGIRRRRPLVQADVLRRCRRLRAAHHSRPEHGRGQAHLRQRVRARATAEGERGYTRPRTTPGAGGVLVQIDQEIGTTDILGTALPYGSPPAIVSEVCLERAVEHWQQNQSPYGIIGMGELGATYIARDTGTGTAISSPC